MKVVIGAGTRRRPVPYVSARRHRVPRPHRHARERQLPVSGGTVPADHSRATSWPVIVDLHGNGAQGTDALLPTARGLADQIRQNRSRFPAVVVFPQAAVGKRWFDAEMEDLVIAELDRTMSEFGGDPARVYLTGFSMGGTGVYRIAYRWPTRFAALVAVAGRVDSSGAASYSDQDKEADRQANPFVRAADPFAALAAKIAHVPIRIFHGGADETVPVEHPPAGGRVEGGRCEESPLRRIRWCGSCGRSGEGLWRRGTLHLALCSAPVTGVRSCFLHVCPLSEAHCASCRSESRSVIVVRISNTELWNRRTGGMSSQGDTVARNKI